MQKNIILISLAIAFLSIIFIIVSFLVLITRGNKPSFISKKLLIGALIITLTAMISSCSNGNGVVKCYDTSAIDNGDGGDNDILVECYEIADDSNRISLYNTFSEGAIQLNIDESNIIYGSISNRKSKEFSFRISTKEDDKTVQNGNISYVYEEGLDKFEIEVDKSIPKGEYILYIFNVNLETQEANLELYIRSYYININ
jgi:hypothetical protein